MAETVVVLTIKHTGQLPQDLLNKLTDRAYNVCTRDGHRVDVSAKEWYALEVKEA